MKNNKDNSVIIATFLLSVILILIVGETLIDEEHWMYQANLGLMITMFLSAVYFTFQEIWGSKDE
tara:strand:+ start:429 stop:623 length:195 start_codon:yes stop_codon:yes gene_type:complete